MEEIDLKEMFLYFWKKKIWIIVAIVIFIILGVLYDNFCVTPIYASSTSLVLTKTEFENDADVTSFFKSVDRYKEVASSKKVANKVITNLKIEMNLREFLENTNITAVPSSQTIWIEILNTDAKKAATIANEMAKVTIEELKNIYNESNVQVLDVATPNSIAYNESSLNNMWKFVVAGVVLSLGYFLVIYMFKGSKINESKK